MTILEAHVGEDNWPALRTAYADGTKKLPDAMIETFLIQSAADMSLWRIVSLWKSRAALEEMRRSVETPGGILMFRAAGAEPELSIFDVDAHYQAKQQ